MRGVRGGGSTRLAVVYAHSVARSFAASCAARPSSQREAVASVHPSLPRKPVVALLQRSASVSLAPADTGTQSALTVQQPGITSGRVAEPPHAPTPELRAIDIHYTASGCHCLQEWKYENQFKSDCNPEPSNFSAGYPWCQVSDQCLEVAGTLPNGGSWDFCAVPEKIPHAQTMGGCHCSPLWKYDGQFYKSCSPGSVGGFEPWCYVFESRQHCPDSIVSASDGRPWDYCGTLERTSSYLTRHGCHCMPRYYYNEKETHGCTNLDLGPDIGVANACAVFEDSNECPYVLDARDHLLRFDLCDIPTGQESHLIPQLTQAASSSCHCRPVWDYQDVAYHGCVRAEELPGVAQHLPGWCVIIEDERLCSEQDGTTMHQANGKGHQRWRYCEPPASTNITVPLPLVSN